MSRPIDGGQIEATTKLQRCFSENLSESTNSFGILSEFLRVSPLQRQIVVTYVVIVVTYVVIVVATALFSTFSRVVDVG